MKCCLCRADSSIYRPVEEYAHNGLLEPTDLPGSGWRCADADACAQRVRGIVTAHREWAAMVTE